MLVDDIKIGHGLASTIAFPNEIWERGKLDQIERVYACSETLAFSPDLFLTDPSYETIPHASSSSFCFRRNAFPGFFFRNDRPAFYRRLLAGPDRDKCACGYGLQ